MLAFLLALFALPVAFSASAAVTGTVMTPDGAPVAGARVSLFTVETPEARRLRWLSATPEQTPLTTAQTDARGNFSLESPKEPVVELKINAAGFDPSQRRIERDEEVGAVALVKSEMKSGTIRGGGKALAGATVIVVYGGSAEYIVKTDAQGKYEAPDPKRARSITVLHPQFAIDDESFFTAASTGALTRTLSAGTTLTGRVLGIDGTTPAAKAALFVDNWPLGASGDDGTFTIERVPSKWQAIVAQSGNLSATRIQSNEKSVTLKLAKAGTLTGRVTDTKTKLPVAGAFVGAGQRTGRIMTSPSVGALTDAKGNFSIHVAPGMYIVSASHPGYDFRDPLEVGIAAGQGQARELTMPPLARVSGVVSGDDNKPVAAARLTPEAVANDMFVMGPGMRSFRDNIAVSGPDGRFSMRISGDFDLRLKAAKRGLPEAKSEAFRVAAGERKSGVVLTIPSGIPVSGRVVDSEGKPLSGVAVTAAEAQSGRGGMMVRNVVMIGGPQQEEDAVRTGSDGAFTLRVKEGTYDFSFKREGYAARTLRGLAISTSQNDPLEATLDPAVEITGRVVRNGSGVDGVMINTFSESGAGASTTTGPDGSFTLGGLTPGEIRASIRKETDFIGEMRMMTAPGRDITIEIPSGVRVTGRVVDKATHKPIGTFSAGVSQSRSGGGMVMMGPPQLKPFTSDDGSFVLDNIPTGAVNLIAQAPGYAQARMNLTVEEGKPLSDIELELDPGTKLVGKVTGPDGQGLSGVNVRVASAVGGGTAIMFAGGAKSAVTDSDGEYTIDALEPTDENIEFSHSKYVGTRKQIAVKGREVRLDVQLTSGQRVSGVVVTEGGAPVADAEIEAMAGAGTFRSARSDASGAFTFESLPPARYRFSAGKRGFAEATVEDFDISSGAPLRLVLKSGATLYGQVHGLTAEELQHTTIEARGETFASAAVDSKGGFRIEGAPVGTVRVAAVVSKNFTSRKTSQPETVTVNAGESRQIDLEFSSDTVISGRVLRNGKPMPSASVSFAPRRGASHQTSSSTSTDDQGNYSVSGLEPGEYNVTVLDTQRFSPYTTTLEVRGTATFDIDYTASALRGRVVDASTGDPINDARVQLRALSSDTPFRGDRAAATDVNGTFTIDFVAPGTYTVTADKNGFGNEAREVTIGERTPADIELKLPKNDGVTLKVVDARNGQALNAMVWVFDSAGRVVQETGMRFGGSDSAADVRLALSPGAFTATVTSIGYAPVSVNLTSPGTEVVRLSPGGKIVVRSTRSDRQRIRLVDAAGRQYPRTPNPNTARELAANPATSQYDHVAPGSYTIQVLTNNDTNVVKSVPVTVTEGGVAEVDV